MANEWNTGSVAAFLLDVIDGIPSSISGTRLIQMANQQQKLIGDKIGITIGDTAIPLQYQSMIWKFTAAEVLDMMSLTGTKASKISLGDFEIRKNQDMPTVFSAIAFRDAANKELEAYGVHVKFYKALG